MPVTDAVTNPDSFFEQRLSGLSMVQAAGIVVLVAALNIVSSSLLLQHAMSGLPVEAQQQIGTIMYASTVVGALVGTAVIWLVVAAVFHFLSTLVYDGEGSYRDTLVVTGWGYIPQLFTAVLSIAIIYYVLFVQGIAPPELSAVEEFQQYTQSLNQIPAIQLTSVLSIAGVLWSGFIWISGVSRVQDIDEGDAFIVVAVPVAINVVWILFNLL